MTAKVVVVFNQKGGAGKTELSMQAGGTLGLRGFNVLVIDLDPQGTATSWYGQASEAKPFPAQVVNQAALKGNVHKEIRKQADNYDFIIVDCPPAAESPAPSSAMLVADLALIPVKPSPADMWATVAAKKLALLAKGMNESLQIRVVVNMVRSTKLATDIRDLMSEDVEVPLTKASLALRTAYEESQALGCTVHSVRSAKEAVEEVEVLVDEMLDVLAMPRKKRGA